MFVTFVAKIKTYGVHTAAESTRNAALACTRLAEAASCLDDITLLLFCRAMRSEREEAQTDIRLVFVCSVRSWSRDMVSLA